MKYKYNGRQKEIGENNNANVVYTFRAILKAGI